MTEKPFLKEQRKFRRKDDNYVFISYSHLDSAIVYNDLKVLYNAGLRYWYDEALVLGKEWNVEAEKAMDDEEGKCLGIIFFMTENLFMSGAVQKEIEMYHKIKQKRENFSFLCISPGDLSVNMLIRNVYLRMSDVDGKTLNQNFPLDRLECIIKTFTDATKFLGRNKEIEWEGHIPKLVENLKTWGPLFANDESRLDAFTGKVLKNVNGKYFLEMGRYPQNYKENTMGNDGIFSKAGKDYFAIKGRAFSFSDIVWKLIEPDGNYGIFISDICLDFVPGTTYDKLDLEDWLKKDFVDLAFNAGEREALEYISVLSKDYLERNKDNIGEVSSKSEYFEEKSGGVGTYSIWLSDTVGDTKRMYTNKKCSVVLGEIPSRVGAGVRPIIKIDLEKYAAQKQSND